MWRSLWQVLGNRQRRPAFRGHSISVPGENARHYEHRVCPEWSHSGLMGPPVAQCVACGWLRGLPHDSGVSGSSMNSCYGLDLK